MVNIALENIKLESIFQGIAGLPISSREQNTRLLSLGLQIAELNWGLQAQEMLYRGQNYTISSNGRIELIQAAKREWDELFRQWWMTRSTFTKDRISLFPEVQMWFHRPCFPDVRTARFLETQSPKPRIYDWFGKLLSRSKTILYL